VAERPAAFDHVGLLVNGPPGTAGLPFIQSSDDKKLNYSPGRAFGPPRLHYYLYCTAPSGQSKWLAAPAPGIMSAGPPAGRHPNPVVPRGPPVGNRDAVEVAVKTQGEIEAAVCAGMTRFEQDYMGRGPKDVRAHLLGDLLVVRLRGVLSAAEQQLVKALPAEKGRDLLKQVRTHLIETARPVIEAMVQDATGSKVVSLHHDISTLTGEEVFLLTLADAPAFREVKKK
jgi:uncharacterized protein YbcI